jgi:dihydropteridine reductase
MLGYGLSKAATHYLVKSLAVDPALQSTVTSLAILPVTIDTPANRAAMPKADFTAWTRVSSR